MRILANKPDWFCQLLLIQQFDILISEETVLVSRESEEFGLALIFTMLKWKQKYLDKICPGGKEMLCHFGSVDVCNIARANKVKFGPKLAFLAK